MSREGATRMAAHIIEDAPPGFVKYVHVEPQDDDLAPARGLLRGTLIGTAIWTLIGVGLALLLSGCATLHENHVRRLQKEPFGEALLTCEEQMKQAPDYAAKQAGSAVAAFVTPFGVGGDSARRQYLTLCMGDAGWTPKRPDTLWPWRPMTPAELENWPTVKAAHREYEKAREDSLRPGGPR